MTENEIVCPKTKLLCNASACTSECYLEGSDIEPLTGFQSQCPIIGNHGPNKENISAKQ
jgi:hypothetical protein